MYAQLDVENLTKIRRLDFGQILFDENLKIVEVNSFVASHANVVVDLCQGLPISQVFPTLNIDRLATLVAHLVRSGSSCLVDGVDGDPLWPDLFQESGDVQLGRQLSLLSQIERRESPTHYTLILLHRDDLDPVYEQSLEKQALANQRMLQSEKLAAIGQLAAGVAHEINNPLGFVFSNLKTLGEYVRDMIRIVDEVDNANDLEMVKELKRRLDYEYIRSDVGSLLLESEDGIDRVKTIITALKDFSHIGEEEFRAADLHRGLDTTLSVVNNELKYKANVLKEYGDLPEVECIASQINQVAMNLLVNAAHAIDGFGKITIRTGHENGWAWFEVQDSGKGIEATVLNRIFEPFFTTKPVGKGTGLGLALSYNIVQKHHGRIEVESQVGVGTSFRVWLPVSQPAAIAERRS
ncbi:ATP-binding protein [Acidovorax sp. Root70]|uniref:ATP-binding protein n=1 Tax=Acidovorax sp. Root70 TaxID=1736590 RepID=UPI0006FC6B9D|nr:ATP-binding protein [Acidovorax sp. Root70]KRB27771.1 histidine kinase [Acidovorax sp. Root70]